ncbi:MAG: tetratricopeptide repeat protein [Myxococcota bacterium]|nr:tetratricopeptide repeat protein [Myxococcota bacterium]
MKLESLRAVAWGAVLVGSFVRQARAADPVGSAESELVRVSHEMLSVQSVVERAKSERQTPEQRVANGELLYRSNDFARAIVLLSEILEEFPNTPSYPDALWLRGETYYAAHDYLAARRDYRALVDHGDDPRFKVYFGRALARLVDVVLRVNDPPEALGPIFEKFKLVPPAQVDAALLYAEGKAYYRQGAWNDAARAFGQVATHTAYTHQARYFEGLIAMKIAGGAALAPSGVSAPAGGSDGAPSEKGKTRTQYNQAIEMFRAVTELPPDTPEHQHVIDLAWMAVGRLFYEMEQYARASQAYAKVVRDSPEFETMLYELAWVYVRLGDVQRAERALEVLMVSDPQSPNIANATLLRADLLLRAGAFERALQLYESIRAEYDPMRAKVDAFMGSTKDVSAYYEKLSEQQFDVLARDDQIPPLAIRWAREAEDGSLAFAVIDDVNECKTLIRQSKQLIDKLTALTGASNRVRAFPELEAGEQAALGLVNRISRARLTLAHAVDAEEPGDLGGEIGQVRQQRRTLMAAIEGLPVGAPDFAAREQQGKSQWNGLSQELTRRSMEIDSLNATVNGLRRMLSEGPARGVVRDPSSTVRFQAELDANEHNLKLDVAEIEELRRQVEFGRAQIGLGDSRYQHDAGARLQFRQTLEREVQLASGGAAGAGAQRFTIQVGPVLSQANQYESQLIAALQQLESQVAARAGELQHKIEVERVNVDSFQTQLGSLDNEARGLVGEVAQRNFGIVRDKLRGIVLRADVGITEQAWEVREEEVGRVRSLQSERSRQEQLLDEELKEVRDDGVEPGQSNK